MLKSNSASRLQFYARHRSSATGQDTVLPNGVNASPASLKCCTPNGKPIMVTQNSRPSPMWVSAMGMPPTNHHITFINRFRHPLDVGTGTTLVPNGIRATCASLMVCRPNGMPIMVHMSSTLDTTYSMAIRKPPNTIQMTLRSRFIG